MNEPNDNLPACAGCGKCCHLLVELAPGVDDGVPEEFVVEHSGVRCMDQQGDGACVALDPETLLCAIYERRPQVCRDFARGSGLCRKILIGRHALFEPAVNRADNASGLLSSLG